VSIMVWVTRILLIGSLTLSDQRTTTKSQTRVARPSTHTSVSPRYNSSGSTLTSRGASLQSKVPVQSNLKQPRFSNRPDPEYVSDPTSSIQQPAFQGRSQNNTSVRRF